jgi:hypothetical protein
MTKVFLLGSVLPELTGSRLPTNGQMLRHLLYFTQVLSYTLPNSIDATLSDTTVFWDKAGLETKAIQCQQNSLKKLYNRWAALRKTNAKKREGECFKKNVESFMTEMDHGTVGQDSLI